ncbi:hypothetical protein AX14_000824 [Amanita brunnescens Koide BX004]|nr:hypothetical protein AX14_000824 [Amanita brunnescens Koide BX004]
MVLPAPPSYHRVSILLIDARRRPPHLTFAYEILWVLALPIEEKTKFDGKKRKEDTTAEVKEVDDPYPV